MSNVIVLDESLKEISNIELPSRFNSIKGHNLYLYVKYYLSSIRANNANTKTRGNVTGGGKKPWSQKGRGKARAGSITSPIFVGGGISHGPTNKKNYSIKVNKKQKQLALEYAMEQKAKFNKFFIVDSINIKSGKTRDAFKFFDAFKTKSVLFVCSDFNDKTYLSFRNINKCCLININDINAYFISSYNAIVIEKNAFEYLLDKSLRK